MWWGEHPSDRHFPKVFAIAMRKTCIFLMFSLILLQKSEALFNLGTLLGTLLPPDPQYRPRLHRVFYGHGGNELTSCGGTAKLLEKEFIQLISKFWVKTRAKNTKKLLDDIKLSKKTANGPLCFMEKYIEKKAYPQEVLLACLQWSQAYRQEYQTTCGNVLTSGDVLVILPGHNII